MGQTISLKHMTFSYTGHFKPVFKDVNLQLNTDWKLGLIGRNGRGKTTLINLLHGKLEPDSGGIDIGVSTEIFPYDYNKTYEKTLDVVKDNIGPYMVLEKQMEVLLKKKDDISMIDYGDVVNRYSEMGGYEIEALISKEFNLIDLSQEMLDRPFKTLSGGEQTKALIVALFLRKNHFLLLDEPTNHLDLEGKRTLGNYLSKKNGFIIVSHDRAFLDMSVDHILSINKQSIAIEKGNFSSWNENRLLKEGYELRTKDKIEKEVNRMEKAAKSSRRFSSEREASKIGAYDKGFEGARAARMMKRAKNIERRQNEQLEEKKKLLKNYEFIPKLVIKQDKIERKELVLVQNLYYSYHERRVLNNVSFRIERGDRIWIKGLNGSGKSTLLHILRGRLKDYEGIVQIHEPIEFAESYQNALWVEGDLRMCLRESKVDETTFRKVMAYFHMYEEFFERPLETYSQGELKKIDIARALSLPNHIIVLDEPLNYMDIHFREQLEKAILHYEPTILFVEHDAVFGSSVHTKVIELT